MTWWWKLSGSVSEWSPLSLSGLQIWLDANDFVSAGAISQWNDKSGNARHYSQGTGANQPSVVLSAYNGRPCVRFDGTSDFMEATAVDLFTSGTPFAVYCVTKYNALAANSFHTLWSVPVVSADTESYFVTLSNHASYNDWVNGGWPEWKSYCVTPGHDYVNNAWEWHYDGGDATLLGSFSQYKNNSSLGQTVKSDSNFNDSRLLIGAYPNFNFWWDGDICEFLVYTGTAHTSGDRATVFSYLQTKWGTP